MDIFVIDKNLCENIKILRDKRGILAQNILAQLRNLVEAVTIIVYDKANNKQNIDTNYNRIKKAINFIKSQVKFKFLKDFHQSLQQTASHYTLDESNSERLMLKYYEYLLKIRNFLKEQHNIEILHNLEDFKIDTNKTSWEYYKKIAQCINDKKELSDISQTDRYYIQKKSPFFIDNQVYYEITFIAARDNTSKFNRLIAFSKLDIPTNYAIKFHIRNGHLNILQKPTTIPIIEKWEISIRPCEIISFAEIFQKNYLKVSSNHKEYKALMSFLTTSNYTLTDLVTIRQNHYNFLKEKIIGKEKSLFFEILDKCREITTNNKPGSNVIRYLLYTLHNKTIKQQLHNTTNEKLSNLRLRYECIPFDTMPFASSLVGHNPKLYILLNSLDYKNKEHEFLARFIKNKAEIHGKLFVSKSDISTCDIHQLIKKYNSKLYYKHEDRKLKSYKDFIYMSGYLQNTIKIIQNIKELTNAKPKGCTEFISHWLSQNANLVDCEVKKQALKSMFANSSVSLIYGAAGTGKTTFLNHISQIFNDKKKLYLANTNTAIDNLKQKIQSRESSFITITKFLSTTIDTKYDIVFIDECSTISNSDMLKTLDKINSTLLVLAGDTFQIEAIRFGNWFNALRSFVDKRCIVELEKTYRTNEENLIKLWDKVRKREDYILEHIANNGYSADFNDSIFTSKNDPIILALNYDGLYGINNLNRLLQNNNPNPSIHWGDFIYKVNDPILFNETKRFAPTLYNNLKGIIRKIEIDNKQKNERIYFEIQIDKILTEVDKKCEFELLEVGKENSLIKFYVNKHSNTDEDEEKSDTQIPFQVSYAISIHKAQGLEYDCVKIIIADEIDEQITHNIFYTAITRAKKNLTIHWSAEAQHKILKNLEEAHSHQQQDIRLLESIMNLDSKKN